jgi:hypothetical protein
MFLSRCVYVYPHTRTQTHTHTHTQIPTHTRKFEVAGIRCLSLYVHIYPHTHTHTHIHTRKFEVAGIRMFVTIRACTSIYIYIYIYTHTHTQKHTHRYTLKCHPHIPGSSKWLESDVCYYTYGHGAMYAAKRSSLSTRGGH